MSGTYGFDQMPLKSTLPAAVRGVEPSGGLKSRCASTTTPTPTAVMATTTVTTATRRAAWRLIRAYRFGSGGGGLSPPDDPANTLRPSASLTVRALHVFDPSFGRAASIVIVSPTFREFGLQPLRVRVLGGPPSHCHAWTAPLSSFTSR